MKQNQLSYLIQVIVSRFGVKEKQLLGNERHKEVAEARWILMFILRLFNYSYPSIGRMVNKDHSSVMYGCKRVEQSKELKEIAEEIKGLIGNVEQIEEYRGIKFWGKWKHFFEIYEAKCQICGIEDIVEVHHKIPLRNGGSNRPENLLILCPTHHQMLHLGQLKIENISMPRPVNKEGILTDKPN